MTERLGFRISWRLPIIGFAFFGALTGLFLFGATRPGAPAGGIPAILALGGVMELFPLMLVVLQLRNRGKVIIVSDDAIEVPDRFRRGSDVIAWPAIATVEDRTLSKNGAKVGRALFIRHAGGVAQLLESDIGANAYSRLVESIHRRRT